jgi:hypothetical protein
MNRKIFTAGSVLLVIAWLLVWRYATSVWYEDRSFAYQGLTAAFVILWCTIPFGAVVRLVSAFFSSRVRTSIMNHKLVHIMWFILAAAIVCALFAPILFAGKTKT